MCIFGLYWNLLQSFVSTRNKLIVCNSNFRIEALANYINAIFRKTILNKQQEVLSTCPYTHRLIV